MALPKRVPFVGARFRTLVAVGAAALVTFLGAPSALAAGLSPASTPGSAFVQPPPPGPFDVPTIAAGQTNPFGGNPGSFTVQVTGFPAKTLVVPLQCDGNAPTTPGYDPTIDCDQVTEQAQVETDSSGDATFPAYDPQSGFYPFDGISPQELFTCLAPGQATPPDAPGMVSSVCQLKVTTNDTSINTSDIYMQMVLPSPGTGGTTTTTSTPATTTTSTTVPATTTTTVGGGTTTTTLGGGTTTTTSTTVPTTTTTGATTTTSTPSTTTTSTSTTTTTVPTTTTTSTTTSTSTSTTTSTVPATTTTATTTPGPSITLASSSVAAGGSVALSGSGFDLSATLSVQLQPAPASTGTTTTTTTVAGATTTSSSVAAAIAHATATTTSSTVAPTTTSTTVAPTTTTSTTLAPVSLGTANTDATGAFQATLLIPSTTAAGFYLVLVSDSSQIDQATAALTVTAGSSGATSSTSTSSGSSLSATGTNSRHSLAIAVGMVGLGLLLLAMAWPSEKNRLHHRITRSRTR